MTRDTGIPLFKIVLFSGCLVLLFSWSFTPASAQEFSSNYDVTYDVQEGEITRVTQEVTLTNLTQDFYASEYTLFVHSTDVDNVVARDGVGVIEPEFEVEAEQTRIRVAFNEKIVGEGKQQRFSISYDDPTVTTRHGLAHEIIVPRLADASDVSSYIARVLVPHSFGVETVVHPPPLSREQLAEGKITYTFTKDQLARAGALLTFGGEQFYSLDLKYHLQNPRSTAIRTQIALPPDIDGIQEVHIEVLEPPPITVETDEDGNYLALYELEGNEQMDVVLRGVAHVQAHTSSRVSELGIDSIPQDIRDMYTRPLMYWPADNEFMRRIAQEQIEKAENESVYAQARTLYDYVVETLEYSTDRIEQSSLERYGAQRALQSPQDAVCMEYADLFITLARSVGIPAREVDGYAYTPDVAYLPTIGDVLHAWVEVYIPPHGWVPIDPTWGSTTEGVDYFNRFDVNHVYFSVRGVDSEWPYPAGAYKLSPDQTGDIDVHFSSPEEQVAFYAAQGSFVAEVTTDSSQIAGLPLTGVVTVSNTSPLAIRNGRVVVTKEGSDSAGFSELVGIIPPFGVIEIPFSIDRSSVWQVGEESVSVEVSFENAVNESGILAALVRTIPWVWVVVGITALALVGGMLRYVIVRRSKSPLPSL